MLVEEMVMEKKMVVAVIEHEEAILLLMGKEGVPTPLGLRFYGRLVVKRL